MHPESREEELKKLALAFCTNPRRTAGGRYQQSHLLPGLRLSGKLVPSAQRKGTGKSVLPHGTGE